MEGGEAVGKGGRHEIDNDKVKVETNTDERY